ncbi:MAG TPA: CaiB/BaiF CoA-transferase family protein [Bryobacteraceae bacterium]|jgi:itaconate CoA-transferase|nr:CaiB/BaiF CoA-transferase family protein [Bryobacteraceae bacterium]
MPSLPLDGVVVLSLEHAVSAPLASRHLADLGARVIKIERPGGGDFARDYDRRARGLSSHFVWTNRSKESVTLDLKHAAASEILFKLVEKADVLMQNLAPGAAARLGLGFESLHPRYPRLISCDISGYGATGPFASKKAYDLLIQAEAGLLSITGTPDEPAKCGISIADISAAMYAVTNILAALVQREKTGYGCHIDLSLFESLSEWMGYPLYYTIDGAPPPARSGAFHATVFPYGPFPAGDGRKVFFGLQNEREWLAFCQIVLERPELAADARFATNFLRSEHRAALTEIICEAFSGLSAGEVLARLERAGIASARMNEMAEAWSHPQLKARCRWRSVATPAGPLPMLLPPGRVDAQMAAVPALGEHTEAVLKELGYSESEIARLRESGAV